jgi:uncharacterized protein YkwD
MPIAALPPAPPPVAVAAAARPTWAETAIVRQINVVRRRHHLHKLRTALSLTRVARAHTAAMLAHGVLSHSSFDGSSFSVRLRTAGDRRRYGETLAWAPGKVGVTARMIVNLWLNSPPHRAVLLDGTLRRVGIGRLAGSMATEVGYAVTADFSS